MSGGVSTRLRVSTYLGCVHVPGGFPRAWGESMYQGGVHMSCRGGNLCVFSSESVSLSLPFAPRAEKRISNTPLRTVEGSTMMKAGGLAPGSDPCPATVLG